MVSVGGKMTGKVEPIFQVEQMVTYGVVTRGFSCCFGHFWLPDFILNYLNNA